MLKEYSKGEFLISTDKGKLDINVIHNFLKSSYWAEDIPKETVEKSIQHSYCFGIYKKESQIGFARIVSDFATFAYLADVFVLKEFRGQGLSKWLMECIMDDPNLYNLRTWMLATWDAHGLYKKYGFSKLTEPHKIMAIMKTNPYKK